MSEKLKQKIAQYLKNDIVAAGDNLFRAQAAFKNQPDLTKDYSRSGKSMQSILDDYQKWYDEATSFLKEFNQLT